MQLQFLECLPHTGIHSDDVDGKSSLVWINEDVVSNGPHSGCGTAMGGVVGRGFSCTLEQEHPRAGLPDQ